MTNIMKKSFRIGVDIGGTKIEGIIIDDHGKQLTRRRVKTPAGKYLSIIKSVCELVSDMNKNDLLSPDIPVGVGIPGTICNETGLVKNANSVCLIGKPLKEDLSKALSRRIRIENDANCFVTSEAVDGAGKGLKVIFGAILGTGVGGGIAIDGSPWIGTNLIAGEWGHNPLPWALADKKWPAGRDETPGPKCYCGKFGCIETFLSGPALARDHGSKFSSAEINVLATKGDLKAKNSIKRYEHRLARALASIINTIDPDAIILGGGLSNINRLYKNVPTLWGKWIFSPNCKTPLLKNVHGDSSGVRGAAWLN